MSLRLTPLLALLIACAPALPPVQAPTPTELSTLRQRAARDPTPEAQVALGAALRAAGERDSARALLQRVVAAHPRHAAAVLYLGITADELGDYAAADSLYHAYLALGRSAPLKGEVSRRLALVQRQALTASIRNALATEAQLSQLPPEPRALAVFPFGYTGADPRMQSLSRALAALLTTDLAQTDRVRVLERTQVQALLGEIKLSASGLVDPATAVRGGRLLRAERVVQGQLGGDERSLRIAAAVVPVVRGRGAPPPPIEVRDRLAGLFEMEKTLALGVYRSLGIELTVAERERVTHHATENIEALLEFGWGLQAEDAGQPAQAAEHFRRAWQLDPGFLDARQHATSDDALVEAASLTPNRLAQGARAEMPLTVLGPPLLLGGFRPRGTATLGLDPLRVLLPDPILRNPGAELLGLDGVTAPATLVIVIGH